MKSLHIEIYDKRGIIYITLKNLIIENVKCTNLRSNVEKWCQKVNIGKGQDWSKALKKLNDENYKHIVCRRDISTDFELIYKGSLSDINL